MSRSIPHATEPLLDGTGRLTRAWFAYLSSLSPSEASAALQQQIDRLWQEFQNLPAAGLPKYTEVVGSDPIEVEGTLASGRVVISLADLHDAGGGTLKKIVRDDKGRVSGTSDPTTDDLPEGATNLYFTDERAAAAAPVQSVNGKTGDVVLNAADVGAADSSALSDYLLRDGTNDFSGLVLRYSGALLNITANTTTGADTGRTALCGGGGLGLSRGGYVVGYGNNHPTLPGQINFFAGSGFDAVANAAAFRPAGNNVTSLGSASFRWSVVYAATGTINTSDAREKTEVRPLNSQEIAAAIDLGNEIGAYQWLAMIAEKGEAGARLHIGMTVQRAISIMEAHGLDPMRYGFVCYDSWDELPEVMGEDGEVAQEYRPAGDRYSFRMDELLAFIARGFAHRLNLIEQRLAAAGL